MDLRAQSVKSNLGVIGCIWSLYKSLCASSLVYPLFTGPRPCLLL